MRKITQLLLDAVGAQRELLQGAIKIPKGKKLVGLLLKTTFPVANTSGGALTLTDAQRQTLLNCLQFDVKYGKEKGFQPYIAQGGARLQREYRYAFGSELELYADTVTGLANEVANGATESCAVYQGVPLGRMWMLPEKDRMVFGMGRSQAATLEVTVRRISNVIAAGLAISGDVTLDVFPVLESCKGDRWGIVPEYREHDRTEDEVELEESLPLRISERTAATHAASALTRVSVRIDDEVILDQMNPQDSIVPYNDVPNVPAAASLTDRETILYRLQPGDQMERLPTGRPLIRQDTKDLATIKLAYLRVPIYGSDKLNAEMEGVTETTRKKELKGVSQSAFDGVKLPQRLKPFEGFVLVDRDDREYEQLPGIRVLPGQRASLHIPASIEAAAKSQFNAHKAAGEPKSAENVAKQLAAMVPGAVPSGRGFNNGSSGLLARVRSFFS